MAGSQIFSVTFSVGPTEQSFTAETKSKLNRFLYCRHALTRSLQVFFQPKKTPVPQNIYLTKRKILCLGKKIISEVWGFFVCFCFAFVCFYKKQRKIPHYVT